MILTEGGQGTELKEPYSKEGCHCDISWASELQREQPDQQMSFAKATEIHTFMSICCSLTDCRSHASDPRFISKYCKIFSELGRQIWPSMLTQLHTGITTEKAANIHL